MFVIGVSEFGGVSGEAGYEFDTVDDVGSARPALMMDMRGFDTPEYYLLAFPGEEPPQIECNEDAGGHDTDE